MSDSALFIGWGGVIAGREEKANLVFGEALGFFGERQQRGEVEGVEPFLLEPHGGDLAGFILVRGDAEKLAKIRMSQEFIRLITRAQMVVEGFGVVTGWTGDEGMRQVEDFQVQAQSLFG